MCLLIISDLVECGVLEHQIILKILTKKYSNIFDHIEQNLVNITHSL